MKTAVAALHKDDYMAYFFLFFTTCAWGSLYVANKFVLSSTPPITILFLRYLITSLLFLIMMKFRKRTPIDKSDYKYIILIGFASYFIAVSAQTIGTKLANASIASLINSMNPVFIIFFAALILKEKITAGKIAALALSITGACVILGGASGGGELAGIFFSIVSAVIWSVVSVFIRRIAQKYDPFIITAYAIYIATLCTFPIAVFEYIHTPHGAVFTGQNVLFFLYMGIICTALPHYLWNKSLSMIEAGTCALFYPVQPMVSVLLGSVFLGEAVTARILIGAALIIAGIACTIASAGKRPCS